MVVDSISIARPAHLEICGLTILIMSGCASGLAFERARSRVIEIVAWQCP